MCLSSKASIKLNENITLVTVEGETILPNDLIVKLVFRTDVFQLGTKTN